jgi:hypothetical protein
MGCSRAPTQPRRLTRSRRTADVDECYFLPIEQFLGRRNIQLRLGPTKNNQAHGINWAKDYEFAATLGRRGAIAQLGERRRGTPKVAGSSPAGSTL